MISVRLYNSSNSIQYRDFMKSIRSQYAFDIDVYLKALNITYKLMENHSGRKVMYEDYMSILHAAP